MHGATPSIHTLRAVAGGGYTTFTRFGMQCKWWIRMRFATVKTSTGHELCLLFEVLPGSFTVKLSGSIPQLIRLFSANSSRGGLRPNSPNSMTLALMVYTLAPYGILRDEQSWLLRSSVQRQGRFPQLFGLT